jgi:hypothetical protein
MSCRENLMLIREDNLSKNERRHSYGEVWRELRDYGMAAEAGYY